MGNTLVYTYVCGDILHIGHLAYLNSAAGLGDKLIVGVLTDEAIMEKKPKPLVDFEKRFMLISSLKCVDSVVPQNEYSPVVNLKSIKPDILVESQSHDDTLIRDHTPEIGRRPPAAAILAAGPGFSAGNRTGSLNTLGE